MAVKGVLKATPTVYEIGVDLPEARYHELVQRVGDWFAEIRSTKEPVAAARAAIDACLRGVKPSDGTTPWDAAATASLAKRIRMACRFDLDTMQPLRTGTEKTKKKKEQAKLRKERLKAAATVDPNYPAEYHASQAEAATAALADALGAPAAGYDYAKIGLADRNTRLDGRTARPGDRTYGDDPLEFFTTAERARMEELRASYVHDYPELKGVASQAKLDMLLTLTLLMERLRFRAAKGEKTQAIEFQIQQLTKQIVELERALDIHPDQVRKRQKEREGGTIGEAVRRLEEQVSPALLQRWLAEELILAFQSFHTPSPRDDRGGYQLDEVGLYGATRCRVTTCPECGTKQFAGFTVEEVEAWLVANGYLVPTGRVADTAPVAAPEAPTDA